MLEHVYRRTAASSLLDDVFIATCDEEIARVAARFGARALMTASSHVCATERAAEACAGETADIVVMVQGDEPMVRASMIEEAVTPLLEDPAIGCANLAAPIASEEELCDPNTIKTVFSTCGRALYFSRQPIPGLASDGFDRGRFFKQVCVIPFRAELLRRFPVLPSGPLERSESVDMLRLLENGIHVQIVPTSIRTHAVDSPGDLARVERLMMADSSFTTYL